VSVCSYETCHDGIWHNGSITPCTLNHGTRRSYELSLQSTLLLVENGHYTGHTVKFWLLTMVAWVQSQVRSCGAVMDKVALVKV
jgi:hypothetical protein